MTFSKAVMLLAASFAGGAISMFLAWGGDHVEWHIYFMFCCFAFFFYGLYRPVISMLKGDLVPEEQRTTVYGIFEVGQNCVAGVLLLCTLVTGNVVKVAWIALGVGCFAACASLSLVQKNAALQEIGYDGTERKRGKEEALFASTSKAV